MLDVRAGGFGDPQPVEREQRDQRMLGRRAEPGGDQQGAELVAVQRDGVGLVARPRPPDVRGWRVLQQFLLDRVLAGPGDSDSPAGDRGAGPSLVSRSRAKLSMSARRTAARARDRARHQVRQAVAMTVGTGPRQRLDPLRWRAWLRA